MPPLRILQLEEIPEDARGAFDLSVIGRDKHSRPAVKRTCPRCGDQQWVAMSEVRSNSRFARVRGHCAHCAQIVRSRRQARKEKSSRWRGGRITDAAGYVRVYVDRDLEQKRTRYALEHRVVMEAILGRPLGLDERVHHKNGRRNDNRPENLELWRLVGPGQPAGVRTSDQIHCPGCRCFGGD